MTSEEMREIRADCEDAFSFLVTDFGFRKVKGRFRPDGFEFGYSGPFAGVLVEWYPADPLTVWFVMLVDGAFPPRYTPAGAQVAQRYFDLGDLVSISTGHAVTGERWAREMPDADMPKAMADSLRRHGARVLRGDLTQILELERWIRRNARDAAGS